MIATEDAPSVLLIGRDLQLYIQAVGVVPDRGLATRSSSRVGEEDDLMVVPPRGNTTTPYTARAKAARSDGALYASAVFPPATGFANDPGSPAQRLPREPIALAPTNKLRDVFKHHPARLAGWRCERTLSRPDFSHSSASYWAEGVMGFYRRGTQTCWAAFLKSSRPSRAYPSDYISPPWPRRADIYLMRRHRADKLEQFTRGWCAPNYSAGANEISLQAAIAGGFRKVN